MKNKGDNIILIGMPTCGKSTVGVLLAKKLGYRFIDTDLLLQEFCGKLLHEIIDEEGCDRFIEMEQNVCLSIDAAKTVIATGGSVVYGDKAMRHLCSLGRVIYLKIGYEVMKGRLGDFSHRGVVSHGKSLLDVFNERAVLYERYADIVVDEGCANFDAGDLLFKTLAAVK